MRYKLGDLTPLVFKTSNYGGSWTAITQGIGSEDFVRAVREDPKTRGLLYAATERGMYISFNDGVNWHKLDFNLPPVPITDLIIKDNDLVASTAGRGFWILDDLSALQQATGKFERALTLYQPKPTIRYTFGGFGGIRFPNFGKNPANGVTLDYYLGEEPDSVGIVLEISDEQSRLLRTYISTGDDAAKPRPGTPPPAPVLPTEIGLNRFTWDLRNETFPEVDDAFITGDYRGHMVAPGTYKARLMSSKDTVSTTIEVLPDPNWNITPDEFRVQQEMLQKIDGYVIEIHESINKMRNAKSQLKQYQSNLKDKDEYQDLVVLGDTLMARIDRWEQELVQTKMKTQQDMVNFRSKLGAEFMFLKGYVDNHDPRLTQGAIQRMEDLEEQWIEQKSALDRIINEDLNTYNKLYRDKGIPAVVVD
jgi:hypothetical protein